MRQTRGVTTRPGACSAGVGLSAAQMNQLRRVFFAELGARRRDAADAPDFGVDIERIGAHIAEARRRRPRARVDLSRIHVGDLRLAAACVDDRAGAWAHLISEYEPRLIRAAEAQEGPTQAVVTVRRMLIEMRRAVEGEGRNPLDLRRYFGERPLESWLFERLNGRAAVSAAIRRAHLGKQRADAAHKLRLALELLGNERLSVQRLAEALASSAEMLRIPSEVPARAACVEDKHG